MRYFSILLVFAAGMVLSIGCESNSTDSDSNTVVSDAQKLLGLQANSHSTYVRYDSIYQYFPDFDIQVDTTEFTFEVVGLDSAFERLDVYFDSIKSHSIRITATHVVNLGYYRTVNGNDTLAFFAQPPEIFPLVVEKDTEWESFTPPMTTDSRPVVTSRLFLSWGLEIERSYLRTESLLLPIGQFNCIVFRNEFRLPGESEIFKTEYEYYAPEYGLVKLYSTGLFGRSHTFMISHTIDSAQAALVNK